MNEPELLIIYEYQQSPSRGLEARADAAGGRLAGHHRDHRHAGVGGIRLQVTRAAGSRWTGGRKNPWFGRTGKLVLRLLAPTTTAAGVEETITAMYGENDTTVAMARWQKSVTTVTSKLIGVNCCLKILLARRRRGTCDDRSFQRPSARCGRRPDGSHRHAADGRRCAALIRDNYPDQATAPCNPDHSRHYHAMTDHHII